VSAFEHQNLFASFREISATNQPIVAGADDDGIILGWHAIYPLLVLLAGILR
jgi:hypothetical protein